MTVPRGCRKSNPAVPAALDVCLFLPGVGSVLDYEWTEPASQRGMSAETPSPQDLEALNRARSILAEQQKIERLLREAA